jgi:hypothetical protein
MRSRCADSFFAESFTDLLRIFYADRLRQPLRSGEKTTTRPRWGRRKKVMINRTRAHWPIKGPASGRALLPWTTCRCCYPTGYYRAVQAPCCRLVWRRAWTRRTNWIAIVVAAVKVLFLTTAANAWSVTSFAAAVRGVGEIGLPNSEMSWRSRPYSTGE